MKLAKLTPFLSVSPQITEADLGTLAAQGFRAVINNRPDGEAEDQPASVALADAARRVGREYRHVPVVSGKIADDDVVAFTQATEELKGPVQRPGHGPAAALLFP
jgi:sulfide:quinone oxidoreductase